MTELMEFVRAATGALSAVDWHGLMTAPAAPFVYATMCGWVVLRQIRLLREKAATQHLRQSLAWANDPARQRSIGRP